MTRAFEKIKAGLEDAIAFARGDRTRATLHTREEILPRSTESSTIRQDHMMSEGIATSASEINGVSGKPRPKEITRSELVRVIARAACCGAVCQEDHCYAHTYSKSAEAVLAALSAAGLAVVPKEATHASAVACMDALDESAVDQPDLYRAMVAAEDLAGERG